MLNTSEENELTSLTVSQVSLTHKFFSIYNFFSHIDLEYFLTKIRAVLRQVREYLCVCAAVYIELTLNYEKPFNFDDITFTYASQIVEIVLVVYPVSIALDTLIFFVVYFY